MNNIVTFSQRCSAAKPQRGRTKGSATIIIFPGVRYERFPSTKRKDSGASCASVPGHKLQPSPV